MNASFYNGKRGSGFWYRGQLNGVEVITIRPKDRDEWIQISDLSEGIEIKRFKNHEFKDAGDLSHLSETSTNEGEKQEIPFSPNLKVGRCRRHVPTINGFPIMLEDDLCGEGEWSRGEREKCGSCRWFLRERKQE